MPVILPLHLTSSKLPTILPQSYPPNKEQTLCPQLLKTILIPIYQFITINYHL